MIVEIITPEKKLFAGDAEMIRVPGTNGSFQILNSHAPIVSTLMQGVITIRQADGKEQDFSVNTGLVECKNNQIIILVE